MRIKNVKGSSKVSGKAPYPYTSWLNYWEEKANFTLEPNTLYKCPACGKSFYRKDFDGCHVQKADSFFDWYWYIVPLCSSCNQSDSILEIGNVTLVSTPSSTGA